MIDVIAPDIFTSMNDLISVKEQLDIAVEQIITVRDHFKKDTGELLVKCYHEIGQIILQLPIRLEAVQELHKRTGMSERTLYYAAAFYEKFPQLDEVPANWNWTKVIENLKPNFHAPENNQLQPSKLQPDFFIPKPNVKLRLCTSCWKSNEDFADLSI